jgi:hypothetical protein
VSYDSGTGREGNLGELGTALNTGNGTQAAQVSITDGHFRVPNLYVGEMIWTTDAFC